MKEKLDPLRRAISAVLFDFEDFVRDGMARTRSHENLCLPREEMADTGERAALGDIGEKSAVGAGERIGAVGEGEMVPEEMATPRVSFDSIGRFGYVSSTPLRLGSTNLLPC